MEKNNSSSTSFNVDGRIDEEAGSVEVVREPTITIATAPGEILHVSTFDSSSVDADDNAKKNDVRQRQSEKSSRRNSMQQREAVLDRLNEALKGTSHHDDHFDFSLFGVWEDVVSQIFYISTFSILGAVIRVYVGRIFGLDCRMAQAGNGMNDFLAPFSSRICVTSNGIMETGALFIDLPANMLGCFAMGLICPKEEGHPLPWLRQDHPLQRHKQFYTGLTVGFCGSLTTFASWNTQMVVMIDGTKTEIGSQVTSAISGYVIGIACACSSFLYGRSVSCWWQGFHSKPDSQYSITLEREDAGHELASTYSTDHSYTSRLKDGLNLMSKLIKIKYGPLLCIAALFSAFVVGDAVYGILFYRKMWMVCILAPLGAVMRWRISVLNKRYLRWTGSLIWLPWGTFFANFAALLISAEGDALEYHYFVKGSSGYEWLSPSLKAIEVGFAGSLSTVSTMVRELYNLETHKQSNIYCSFTIVCGLFFGLLVYSPIVRLL